MVEKETYLAQAARRFGRANPERMDCAHWAEMVRGGEGAWVAARRILGEEVWPEEPRWCFERFGMSRTRLGDGRVVCVGGEHEAYYDPDFCIYNDVVVIEPGGGVAIYGYPEGVFPPTDFHTATRVGDRLIVIGSLGYAGRRRVGRTQVYALDLNSFAIDALETTGEAPGWIYRHHAGLEPDGHTVRVSGGEIARRGADGKEEYEENGRVFRLDLRTLRWTAAEGPWLEPPMPGVAWPGEWEAVGSAVKATDLADALARSVGPWHRLFARDYVVVAKQGDPGDALLLRSAEDPEQFIVSQGPTWCGRDELPLEFETYAGLDAWRAAAEARGGEWRWA